MKEIYSFLEQVDANNNREWFDIHRDEYKSAQQKFLYITELLINEIRSFDREISYMDPKNVCSEYSETCGFRTINDLIKTTLEPILLAMVAKVETLVITCIYSLAHRFCREAFTCPMPLN